MKRVNGAGFHHPELTFRMPTLDESEIVQAWVGRRVSRPSRPRARRPGFPSAPVWRDRASAPPGQRIRAVIVDGRRVGFVRSFRPADVDAFGWPGHTDPGLRAVDVLVTESMGDRRRTAARILWAYSGELLRTPGVRRILVDPDAEDEQAIQAALDVGFQSLGLFTGEDRTSLLLSVRRHELRSLEPGEWKGLSDAVPVSPVSEGR